MGLVVAPANAIETQDADFCTIVCPRFWADHYTLVYYTHPLLGSDEVGWSSHLVIAIPEETHCLILSE